MNPIQESQGFQARVIEHSTTEYGPELITLQLRYPRLVHSEFMTHRVFSRNASSSRAIPVQKMIEQVRNEPAMPVHWGQNQPGMQARQEIQHVGAAKDQWRRAANNAADVAEEMLQLGLHKQVANRILEPFQWIHVIVTATEWTNFFELRDHPDADPNIQLLARLMKGAIEDSKATLREGDGSWAADWHLPYVTVEERMASMSDPCHLARLSTARCARVSYLTHDGQQPDPQKDLELFKRLVGSHPMHASPVEHQGYPLPKEQAYWPCNNFVGWKQFRKILEQSPRANT